MFTKIVKMFCNPDHIKYKFEDGYTVNASSVEFHRFFNRFEDTAALCCKGTIASEKLVGSPGHLTANDRIQVTTKSVYTDSDGRSVNQTLYTTYTIIEIKDTQIKMNVQSNRRQTNSSTYIYAPPGTLTFFLENINGTQTISVQFDMDFRVPNPMCCLTACVFPCMKKEFDIHIADMLTRLRNALNAMDRDDPIVVEGTLV